MKQEQMKDTYEHKSAMKISIRKWETTDAKALASALSNRKVMNNPRTAELGYYLAEEYWGKGIMTEAVRQLCEKLFIEDRSEMDKGNCFLVCMKAEVTNMANEDRKDSWVFCKKIRSRFYRANNSRDFCIYSGLGEFCLSWISAVCDRQMDTAFFGRISRRIYQ